MLRRGRRPRPTDPRRTRPDRSRAGWGPGSEPGADPSPPLLPEVVLTGAIAGQHLLDHLVVPPRYHLATHLAAAAGAVAAALAMGADPDDLGIEPRRALPGLKGGALSAAAITAAIGLGAAMPATRDWFDDQRVLDVQTGEALFRGLVEIPFGTAVYEEIVFRGVILGFAMRRMDPLPAAALTSTLFGLWHVLPALRDRHHHPVTREQHPAAVVAATVANTALVGMALAWQRIRTGSIVAPILTHTASNSVAFLAGVALGQRSRQSRTTRWASGDRLPLTAGPTRLGFALVHL